MAMKKLALGILALTLLSALCACDKAAAPAERTPPPHTAAVQPETPLAAEVTLFLPNATADGSVEKTVELEAAAGDTGISAPALVDALIAHGALPEGVAVNRFAVERGIARLDLNAAFAEAVRAAGTNGETMYLASVVNTFLSNYDCDALALTIEGEALETGHRLYDQPLTMYLFD